MPKRQGAYTKGYLDQIENRSLHHAHAKRICECLAQGSKRFFEGWLKDFPELWVSREEAQAAFNHWRKGRKHNVRP